MSDFHKLPLELTYFLYNLLYTSPYNYQSPSLLINDAGGGIKLALSGGAISQFARYST